MTIVRQFYNEEMLMAEADEAIKSLYIQTVGRAPHHRAKKQKMARDIIEAQNIQDRNQSAFRKDTAPVPAPAVGAAH